MSVSSYKKTLVTFVVLILASCEFHIDHDDECIKCWYDYNGGEVSKEQCDPLWTDADRNLFRMEMQAVADSLNVLLKCLEH